MFLILFLNTAEIYDTKFGSLLIVRLLNTSRLPYFFARLVWGVWKGGSAEECGRASSESMPAYPAGCFAPRRCHRAQFYSTLGVGRRAQRARSGLIP